MIARMGAVDLTVLQWSTRHRAACSLLATIVVIAVGAPMIAQSGATAAKHRAPSSTSCAPLDIALVLDTTSSMDPAIEQVKSGIGDVITQVETESPGNYRLALVDFGTQVRVQVPFESGNADIVRSAVTTLNNDDSGDNGPEAWDQALATVVDARPASAVNADADEHQIGDFTPDWRADAERIVILVTDARPGSFDDTFEPGVHDQRAEAAARQAEERSIRVTTVFVPNGNDEPEAVPVLQRVANLSAGVSFQTLSDGSNLARGLNIAVRGCGADRDGDALFDSWEERGYDADGDGTVDVDLPAMGANPDRKDLFLQFNWMEPDGVTECWLVFWCPGRPQTKPPDPAALARVVDAFAAAPVSNPDGKPGVVVHVDAGPLTPTSDWAIPPSRREGGPTTRYVRSLAAGSKGWTSDEVTRLRRLRSELLSEPRAAVFTWILYGDRIDVDGDLLGSAIAIPNDTLVVSGRRMTSIAIEAVTVMHELGHTLGLGHGGYDRTLGKPNYLSVMNYSFALRNGLERNGVRELLDYSRFRMEFLDQSDLDEPRGLRSVDGNQPRGYVTWRGCHEDLPRRSRKTPVDVPVDWSCDGDAFDTDVDADILDCPEDPSKDCPVSPTPELMSRDDWATLDFGGGDRGGLASEGDALDETDFTEDEWQGTPKPHAVIVSGPTKLSVQRGARRLEIPVTLENVGTRADTFDFDASLDPNGSGDVIAAPESVRVPPGRRRTVRTAISIGDHDGVDPRWLFVTARSRATSSLAATQITKLLVTDDPPRRPRQGPLVINPDEIDVGESLVVSGGGWQPGASVAVWAADPSWDLSVSLRADERGRIRLRVKSPPSAKTTTIAAMSADARRASTAETSAAVDARGPANPGQALLRRAQVSVVDQSGGVDLMVVVATAVVILILCASLVVWAVRRRGPRPRKPGQEPSLGISLGAPCAEPESTLAGGTAWQSSDRIVVTLDPEGADEPDSDDDPPLDIRLH